MLIMERNALAKIGDSTIACDGILFGMNRDEEGNMLYWNGKV